ncbi:hypothetical protein GQ54DRAFT_150430 [Martensiomyces pterosporus]|nr:hypothetical protein GQ54DRAFT_150430 [Martensiomyces pterosporus]
MGLWDFPLLASTLTPSGRTCYTIIPSFTVRHIVTNLPEEPLHCPVKLTTLLEVSYSSGHLSSGLLAAFSIIIILILTIIFDIYSNRSFGKDSFASACGSSRPSPVGEQQCDQFCTPLYLIYLFNMLLKNTAASIAPVATPATPSDRSSSEDRQQKAC